MVKKKKLICICAAIAVFVAALVAVIVSLVQCSDDNGPATIGVTVNGENQYSGITYNAYVGAAYSITATSSDKSAVSISYVFGTEKAQKFTGGTFTPQEEGSYVFTFSAKNAKKFTITFIAADIDFEEVTFNLGDNSNQSAVAPNLQQIAVGDVVVMPDAPAAAYGYTFVGWSDGSGIYGVGTRYTVSHAVNCTAVWEPTRLSVSYALGSHAADNATAPSTQTVDYGASIHLPSAPPAASGYIFMGWSDGKNTYTAGESYSVTVAVSFTADWEQLNENTSVDVKFALGDHALATAAVPPTKNVKVDTTITLPSAPLAAKEYTFDGWDDGTDIYDAGAAYTVKSPATLTALWKANQYTVTFVRGDHAAQTAVVPSSQTVDYGTAITLKPGPDAASGYKFDGWSDGKTTYKAGTLYTVYGNATLTATWTATSTAPVSHTIVNGDFELGDLTGWTYQNGTGDGQILGAKAVTDETRFFAEKIPYNQGGKYHFNGWKAKEDKNEPHTYALKSTTFTLGGSGFISFKMAGNAACVMVYNADDGAVVGEYKNTAFNDVKDNVNLDAGSRLATMTTFVADLSKCLGKRLYIELCDISVNAWAVAFFDDIVTYYATAPTVVGKYDTVGFYKDGYAEGKSTTEYRIPWVTATNSYIDPIVAGENVLLLSFEGTGFTELNSATGNSSTVEGVLNNPVFQAAPVEPYRPKGVEGKALSFDGYSQAISYADGSNVSGAGLTIDVYVCPRTFAWSAPQDPPENHTAHVIVGAFDSGAKRGFMLGFTKFGYPTFRVGTGADWYNLYFTPNQPQYRLPNYEWSRLTAVFDGTNGIMSLYINGTLANSMNIRRGSSIAACDRPILVGRSSEAVVEHDAFEITKFNGLMDELSVATEVNNAAQVKEKGKTMPAIDYATARIPDSMLINDYYRPQYHAAPPANWMNEPHTLFHYKNKWHMFYQYNPVGPYWRNICWGHWVSDDMVQWECVKETVIPTEGTITPDGVWTGNVVFDEKGQPVLLITAGNDLRPNGSNQNVGLVRAKNYNDPYLIDWEIGGYAVQQTSAMGKVGEFRDAQAFGIGNDRYMVVGGEIDGKGAAHVFKTTADKLSNWQYKGNLYRPDDWKDVYGHCWEMPNIVPLSYENGTDSGKYLFVFSPQEGDFNVRYFIGTFNTSTCRFTPDAGFGEAKRMDYTDNVFTGPTVYLDPTTKKVYICSIMQDQRTQEDRYAAGWAFAAGLPRELYLKSNGTLGIKHIDTSSIENGTVVSFQNKSLSEANAQLKNVNSDLIKIDYTISNMQGECGFRLKKGNDGYANLYFTNNTAGISRDTINNQYQRTKGNHSGVRSSGGSTVSGTVYIDKALIEVYYGDSSTLSIYSYGRGMGLEAFGSGMFSVTVTAMKSIRK